MKGDFTRSTFRPHKHYSGVRMQQGRVQLDADWNENLDILLHRIQTETLDVIGQCGVPVHDAAFGVVTDFSTLSADEQAWLSEHDLDTLDPGDFYLTRGRAYVDGILVENDHTLPFSQQPFVLPAGEGLLADAGIYLLYLDVWQRHITALEDPSIREVALGGPDTTTRTQVVWQARLGKVGDPGETVTCADDLHPWPDASTGRLQARTHPEDQPEDPCTVPPAAGYKRLENQLYRVEIHKGSTDGGGPTFKWSRDNGSIAVAISEFAVDGADTKLRTTSLGRDSVLGLHENDWVEISDDASELAGLPGTLVQISTIDPDNILSLSGPVTGYDLTQHPKARRWDVNDTQASGEIALAEGSYIALEGGVEIQFESGGSYRSGDYWLIPARTVPGQYGDIEWPQADDGSGDPAALPAFGIRHHYCKLAVLTVEVAKDGAGITDVDDCRDKFPPLTELPTGGDCCCSVSVGNGGDYPDLQSALAARPADANEWRICLIAGEYQLGATLTADGANGLVISGCGRQTRVIGPAGQPAFAFSNSRDLRIENLWVEASSPLAAILLDHCAAVTVNDCLVANQINALPGEAAYNGPTLGRGSVRFGKPGPGIVARNGRQVELRDNQVLGLPAILAGGADLQVLRNRLMGGGIQIIAPAALVEIRENTITKGFGPGIQLGGGEDDFSTYSEVFGNATTASKTGAESPGTRAKNPLAGIRTVAISGNLIGGMRGSGIVTELGLQPKASLSEVEHLSIHDNQIIECCDTPDLLLSPSTRVGGGIALIGVFSARISNNLIAANGSATVPACGIFLLNGSDIDLDANAILENGSTTANDKIDSYQAGIAAQFIFGNFLGIGQDSTGKPGYPALRVRGNQVVCPAGQALSISAVGSVLVEGNNLSTRERLAQPAAPLHFGEKGACVAILNMGLPVWLPDFAVLFQMMASGQTNLHAETFEKVDEFFARFPDGRIQFNDNQVTFNSEVQETVESLGEMNGQWFSRAWNAASFSTLLVSLDDISIDGNQFQATVPPYTLEGLDKFQKKQISLVELFAYLLKFMHVGSVGASVRATGNGLEERLFSNWISYASNAMAMNITTGNEATHGFATNAPKKVETNNLSLTS